MKKLTVALIGLFLGILGSSNAMATEEPQYDVVLSEGDMELRRYAPMLIAETVIEGDLDEASNKGFRLIADYIFGNNQSADAEQKVKIAMTAPVTVDLSFRLPLPKMTLAGSAVYRNGCTVLSSLLDQRA